MNEGHKVNNQHGDKVMEAGNEGLVENQILPKKYCTFDSYESVLSVSNGNWSKY